jgi:hypothetical protein
LIVIFIGKSRKKTKEKLRLELQVIEKQGIINQFWNYLVKRIIIAFPREADLKTRKIDPISSTFLDNYCNEIAIYCNESAIQR